MEEWKDATDPSRPSSRHPADPSWRADALGRSQHGRLADELREPLEDIDPKRAEIVCAEVARAALGDYAPGFILLSAPRRRRAQALAAWTVALFDLARRPGLAGLDGDRLAQINAWEFRTEEALDGNPPGQPLFARMSEEEKAQGWPREALSAIMAAARKEVFCDPLSADSLSDLSRSILTALLEDRDAAPEAASDAARALTPLLATALEHNSATQPPRNIDSRTAPNAAPPGWRRAASYAKRVTRARLAGKQVALGARVRMLVAAWLWPR